MLSQRILLFYLLCIPIRFLFVYLAYKSYAKYAFVAMTTIIGIGFWTIYVKGWRKTGIETGGQPIWWNDLRPIHGSLYLLYSILTMSGVKNAWIVLLVDVLIGFGASITHYW